MIRIEIETDNAAFDGEDWELEVERLLTSLAQRLNPSEPGPYNLHDANGNYCGKATIE
jgi:hypothetical protein